VSDGEEHHNHGETGPMRKKNRNMEREAERQRDGGRNGKKNRVHLRN